MTTAGAWRTISVALQADVGGYLTNLNRAQQATTQFGVETEKSTEKSGRSWKGMIQQAAGVAGITVGIAAVVKAGQMMVGQAISWESAFAGVRKTVDATEAEFSALSDGIIAMANRLPATREEIAGVAEAAGQLGIATPNILSFTETMIGMGEATNLAADQAATELARFANITQMSQQDFDRLGSTIVELGNNFATTEAEIVAMSLRIASAGTQVGMTEPQIMALAAALSSVGIDAEAGGTAISRVMISIASAVDAGGESLEAFAAAAEMSSTEFAQLWRDDSTAALTAFVEGLGRAEERGLSMFAMLDELGLADVRVGNALRSMAGAGELLGSSFGMATEAFEENTALADEVAERYKTAGAQLEMFRNQVTNLARIAGEQLVPVLLALSSGVQSVGSWLHDLGSSDAVQGGFESLATAGRNLVEILEALIAAGRPVAEVLVGLGAGLVVASFVALAEALEWVTGGLSAIEPLLTVAAVAAAGLGASFVVTTVGSWAATAAYAAMSKGLITLAAAQAQAAAASIGLGGALGIVAAAAIYAYSEVQKWGREGRERTSNWMEGLVDGADETIETMEQQADQARRLADGLRDSLSTGWRAYTIDIDFNIETKASAEEAERLAEQLEIAAAQIQTAANVAGTSTEFVFAALDAQDLDYRTASLEEITGAVIAYTAAMGAASPAAAQMTIEMAAQDEAISDAVESARTLYDAHQNLASAQRNELDAQRGLADAHRQVAAAQRGVAEAAKGIETARRSVIDATRALGDAERSLADAHRTAAAAQDDLRQAQLDAAFGTRDLAVANQGAEQAERDLASAQRDSLAAQEDLDAARGRAAENLENLDRAARRAELSERQAALALTEARERLAAPAEDATATDRARAALAVESAQLSLEEAQIRNLKAAEALAEANDKGIEQSDEVTAAHERITAAADAEQVAEEKLAQARERITEVQEQLAQRVEDAHRKVEEANRKVEEAQYRVESAAYRVRDAQDAVGAAQQRLVDARQGVVDARDAVTKAEEAVGEAAWETAEAEYELDKKTMGATDALKLQLERLQDLEAILGPNHPLRAGLRGFIEELEGLAAGADYSNAGPGAWRYEPGYSGRSRRWGGIDDHMATGGIRQAMVGNGRTKVWWDEPETGKEAYVPMLGDPAISIPTITEAASWYDLDVSRRAPSGGMDAAMFAQAVAAATSGSSGPLFSDGAIRVETGASIDPQAVGVMAAATIAAKLAATGVR